MWVCNSRSFHDFSFRSWTRSVLQNFVSDDVGALEQPFDITLQIEGFSLAEFVI